MENERKPATTGEHMVYNSLRRKFRTEIIHLMYENNDGKTVDDVLKELLKKFEYPKCACGCGKDLIDILPYESGGKWYNSAYCILIESECCSYCGGYYGKDPDRKPDFRCSCNFKALDGDYSV